MLYSWSIFNINCKYLSFMWFFLAVISAVCLGFYDVFKKISLRDNAVLPVLWLNTLIPSPNYLLLCWLATNSQSLVCSLCYCRSTLVGISQSNHCAIFMDMWLFCNEASTYYFGRPHQCNATCDDIVRSDACIS